MINDKITYQHIGARKKNSFLDIGYVPWYHILRRTSYLFNIKRNTMSLDAYIQFKIVAISEIKEIYAILKQI